MSRSVSLRLVDPSKLPYLKHKTLISTDNVGRGLQELTDEISRLRLGNGQRGLEIQLCLANGESVRDVAKQFRRAPSSIHRGRRVALRRARTQILGKLISESIEDIGGCMVSMRTSGHLQCRSDQFAVVLKDCFAQRSGSASANDVARWIRKHRKLLDLAEQAGSAVPSPYVLAERVGNGYTLSAMLLCEDRKTAVDIARHNSVDVFVNISTLSVESEVPHG